MNYKDVRKGNTQAEFNESASTFLGVEITVISIIAGFATTSLAVGGIVFLALLVLMWFKKSAIFITVLLTISWGIVIFVIANMLGGIIAGIVFGIIGLLVSGGFHLGALEWMDDMKSNE